MGTTRSWRLATMMLVMAFVAGACSRTPPGPQIGSDSMTQAPGMEATGTTTGAVGGGAGTGAGVDENTGGTAASGGTAPATNEAEPGTASTATTSNSTDNNQAAGETPGDTNTAAERRGGSVPGVEDGTIKIVFHAQQSECPNNPPQDRNPSEAFIEKGRKIINEYVKFFNEYVLREHGWQLDHQIVDDGGQYCPERQRAAALKIAKEIKPFAALGFSVSPQGPVVADVVTRAGIRHIGTSWPNYAELRARAPYAWAINPVAEKGLESLVEWMTRRVKGTPFPRGGPVGEQPVDRVHGLLGTDNELGRTLAEATAERLRARGFELVNTYYVSPDPGVAAQQGTTLVSQMRQDGVNSLVWALDISGYVSGVALTNAMSSQNYLPDVLIGTYGVAFLDQLHDKRVWANAQGVSSCVIVCLRIELGSDGTPSDEYEGVAENDDAYFKAWEHMGHNDNPQEGASPTASEVWKTLALLATGVIQAGDELDAQSFSRGLDSASTPDSPNRCTVGRLMGRDYRHAPSFEWDSDHDGGGDSFTTVYWVNRQTSFNTNGYYESSDNYTYVADASALSPDPSHDTGEEGVDVQKQQRIGIDPWDSCSQFPNYR